jgi:hypothetical protein
MIIFASFLVIFVLSLLRDSAWFGASPCDDCNVLPVDVADCAASRINPVRCDFTVR